MVAKELNVITDEEWKEVDELRSSASKITWALYNSVRKAAETQS